MPDRKNWPKLTEKWKKKCVCGGGQIKCKINRDVVQLCLTAHSAACDPLTIPKTPRIAKNIPNQPLTSTECCLQEPYQIKNKKKLDITPRPVLQYKNEVEREKKFKCCEKRLDIFLKTLYNESVDVFK